MAARLSVKNQQPRRLVSSVRTGNQIPTHQKSVRPKPRRLQDQQYLGAN